MEDTKQDSSIHHFYNIHMKDMKFTIPLYLLRVEGYVMKKNKGIMINIPLNKDFPLTKDEIN